MPVVRARPVGDFARAMNTEVGAVEKAMRRAMTATGRQVQAELREQARRAGFRDGGKAIANTWRLNIYPGASKSTLHPAALVWSKMPEVVDAFDRARVIRVKNSGREWLAWPTPVNKQRKGVRVTPQEMYRLGGFIIPSRNPAIALWCLPVRGEAGKRGRIKVFAGYSEVLTGRVKGLQQRRKALAKQGFIPMFFLSRQVYQRKRLDIDYVRGRAPGILAGAVRAELAGLA